MSTMDGMYDLGELSRAGWQEKRDLSANGTRLLVLGDAAIADMWRGRGAEVVLLTSADEVAGRGVFDVIACPHVLDAVEDPVATLATLRGALTEDGLVAITVHANYGRLPVYMLQSLMRALVPADMPREVKIAAAREFLKAVPAGHWLAHNSADFIAELNREDGSGIEQLLFAPVCHHFTAAEIYQMLDLCGLAMLGFVGEERTHYAVERMVTSPLLREMVSAKPEYEQHIIADLMHGGIRTHRFYASPLERTPAA